MFTPSPDLEREHEMCKLRPHNAPPPSQPSDVPPIDGLQRLRSASALRVFLAALRAGVWGLPAKGCAMSYVQKVVIGDATLYQGDCMDILPTLSRVDAVITDPPYGLGLRTGTIGVGRQHKNNYMGFDDSPEYVQQSVIPAIVMALFKSSSAVITPGASCMWMYPPADVLGMIFQPAATGMNKWGRSTCQPMLFYGRDPFVGLTIKPIHYQMTEQPEKNGHPCPKPLGFVEWQVARASKYGDIVLDLFMGSGTTGVACAKLGRKFVGIEVNQGYFDIACKRIEQAHAQGQLFAPERPKQEQEALL